MKYDKTFKQQAVALSQKIGVRRAAQQLEIPYDTLADWRRQTRRYGKEDAFGISGMKRAPADENGLRSLEQQNDRLVRENEILRQVLTYFSGPKEATVHLRYRFIDEHKESETVSELCRVLDVSESGYYKYAKGKKERRD